jgi:hypothetical protein
MNGQSQEVRKLLAQLFSHLGQFLMNGHAVSGSQETFSTALGTFRIILDERSQQHKLTTTSAHALAARFRIMNMVCSPLFKKEFEMA